jgi:hypothetical protein
MEGDTERGPDAIWVDDRDLRRFVHGFVPGMAIGSVVGIGGRGISSTGVGGRARLSTGPGGGREGRQPPSVGVRGRARATSRVAREGEDSLDRSGTGFRTNCLVRWVSFSDLEKVARPGKKEENRGRHEHFLLGLVILATAIVDCSPSAAAAAASTGGKCKGEGKTTEDDAAKGAGQPKGVEEIGRGSRDLLLLFKAMMPALPSSQSGSAV